MRHRKRHSEESVYRDHKESGLELPDKQIPCFALHRASLD